MKPVTLLDVDGVVIDFLSSALKIASRHSGRVFNAEDFTTWDIFDVVPREVEDACYKDFHEKGFCEGLPPYPEAKVGVRKLKDLSDVYVVTSPMHQSPHWTYERSRAINKHFGIPPKRHIHAAAKHLVRGDFLIDDKPANCREWQAAHPEGQALLWGQPYNRRDTDLRRIESWDEAHDLIRKWIQRKS